MCQSSAYMEKNGENELIMEDVELFEASEGQVRLVNIFGEEKKLKAKIIEEAEEVVNAETKDEIIWEVADLLYFLVVLMQQKEIKIDDVLMELRRRRWEKTRRVK